MIHTFDRKMKLLGIILVACSLVVSIPVFQVFHEITFGESKLVRMFEIEPPEGYSYWQRKEFWEDCWVFAPASLILVLTACLPFIATFVRLSAGRVSKIVLIVAAVVLSLPLVFFSISLLSPPKFDPILIAAASLLIGCCFSVFCAIHTGTETGGEQTDAGKPDPAAS